MDSISGTIIPFLVLALALGAAIRQALWRWQPLYAVMLLLAGIFLGVSERRGMISQIWPDLGDSLRFAVTLDPLQLLLILLPTLIFESAITIDPRLFKKMLPSLLVMTIPGLLVSAFMIAWLMKMVVCREWDWPAAIMFGALLGATDPRAVLRQIRQTAIGKELSTLIKGESLLNNGFAIVMFLVYYQALGAEGISAATIGRQILWGSLVGPIIGILIAFVTIIWLRNIFNDALVEITVTIVAVYLTYFLSENLLQVSGVLALVSLGLLFSGIGRTSISPEVENYLQRFWELLSFLLHTFVTVLIGVMIALNDHIDFTPGWGSMILVFSALYLIRGLLILVIIPILRWQGYPWSWREGLLLIWGGIRGSIGLVLALILAQYVHVSFTTGGQVVFLATGIFFLSLTFNSMSIERLIRLLGLHRLTPAHSYMLSAATKQLVDETNKTTASLKADRLLCSADWEIVRSYLPKIEFPGNNDELNKTTLLDLAAEARRRLLDAEKKSYWRQYHEGLLGQRSLRQLLDSIDQTLNRGTHLNERPGLEKLWGLSPLIQRLQRFPVLNKLARFYYYNRLADSYNVARGFMSAQEEVLHVIDSVVFNQELLSLLANQIRQNRELGLKTITMMREAFPEITVAIETRTAVNSLLNHMRAVGEKMYKNGFLDEIEANTIIETIEIRMKKIHDTPPTIAYPLPRQMLREIPWLKELDDITFERVVATTREQVFVANEILLREGEPSDRICVIARGTVCVTKLRHGGVQILDVMGAGSVIGEMGVLTHTLRNATVRAESPVNALFIQESDILRIMNDSPTLKSRLWLTAGMRFAENNLIARAPYNSLGQLRLRRWLHQGQIAYPENGKLQRLAGPAVLLRGEAIITEEEVKIITPPALITSSLVTFQAKAMIYLCPGFEVAGES